MWRGLNCDWSSGQGIGGLRVQGFTFWVWCLIAGLGVKKWKFGGGEFEVERLRVEVRGRMV